MNETPKRLSESNPVALAQKVKGWAQSRDKTVGAPRRPIRPIHTVYVLLDCSGSMAGGKISEACDGALGYARDAIEKGFAVGLISFATCATVLTTAVNRTDDLTGMLRQITPGGGTNMSEAITLGITQLSERSGDKVLLLVTDGAPDSRPAAIAAAKKAKESGILIMAIGTEDADREFLREIESRGGFSEIVEARALAQGIRNMAAMLPGRSTSQKCDE